MVSTGAKTSYQLFTKLNSDWCFGDCQGLSIRIHRDELDPVNSISDHAGYGIRSTAAKTYNFNSNRACGKT
jgi:hypothetical protein